MTISTCSENTEFDTEISISTGTCRSMMCVGTTSEGCGGQDAVTIPTVKNRNYFMFIHGSDVSEVGNFEMSVSISEEAHFIS